MDDDFGYGKPLFNNIKYCIRCCVPETQQGQELDEMGVCKACQSSEQKIHIDWSKKEKELRDILEDAKNKSGDNYDCILPLSGGKDSFFQAHVLCNVYGMKPLGVTFNHNLYSETGWYNLQLLLKSFNMDHIMFTPGRETVNKLMKHSLKKMGDTCWHCHAGAGTFPLKTAVKFKIPLMVYGESIAEASGRATYECPIRKFDKEYSLNVSMGKLTADDMIGDDLSRKDLYPFQIIDSKELDEFNVLGIYLGDYVFWDDERQTEFVKKHYGWRETEIEGTYKGYKSAECIMPGMHDYTCYLKRGFGRGTYHASIDVRNGLLTREEGFELAKHFDMTIPEVLDYYLEATGYSLEEFYATMKEHRHKKLQGCEIPVKEKNNKNKEKLIPISEQIIEKFRNKTDAREE